MVLSQALSMRQHLILKILQKVNKCVPSVSPHYARVLDVEVTKPGDGWEDGKMPCVALFG